MDVALAFRQVRKAFGPTVALDELDLALQPGELISLLGPSGCGKTTALRIAAGFEVPDSGSVHIGAADITRIPAHKRHMGMVFQSYSLFPNLTVAENVAFGLRVRRMNAAGRDRRVREMLERVQLAVHVDRYPHQLSGGQQQRVALARALAVQPDVLLLDEPLSALDAKVRVSLRDEIRRLQTELGITTLFVTHDQEEALAISDRVGVMSNGRLEQLDTPTNVYRSPANAFVARFVGSMNQIVGVRRDDQHVSVAGVVVLVPDPPGATGAPVEVLIRPEDVALDAVDAPATLPGTVAGQVFAGASTSVRIRLDGLDELITASVPGRSVHGGWGNASGSVSTVGGRSARSRPPPAADAPARKTSWRSTTHSLFPVGVEIGMRGAAAMTVGVGDTADSFRSGDVPVLATPRVVALVEEATCAAVNGHLPSGWTTVGMRIQLDHLHPTGVGAEVSAEAVLDKVEGRRITFTVSASDARGLVAAGKVTRVLVEIDPFMAKTS